MGYTKTSQKVLIKRNIQYSIQSQTKTSIQANIDHRLNEDIIYTIPLTTGTATNKWTYRSNQHIHVSLKIKQSTTCDTIVSDGSMVHGQGSYGSLMIRNNSEPENITKYTDRVWGNPPTFDSYRAEAGGIADMVLRHRIHPRTIVCDNEAVIKNMPTKADSSPRS